MRSLLLTVAASCAVFLGSLAVPDTAEARPWGRRVWRAPAVSVYSGYRPYYGYQSYYRPYYGYRSYYQPYYGYRSYYRPYSYGYSYGYPYYTARPFYGGGVYIGF
jgi:hypothetical protein